MKNCMESGVQDEDAVLLIQNPEQRKKVPIKLVQKITDSNLAIVGLDFITEYSYKYLKMFDYYDLFIEKGASKIEECKSCSNTSVFGDCGQYPFGVLLSNNF